MDPEKLTVETRPRSPLQGTDLGFAMAREWFVPLWKAYLVTAVPAALILHVVLYRHPVAAALAVWWLKPLYETFLVFWLGRAVFGEKPSLKYMMSNFFSILRPYMLVRLTFRRFSLNRSFFAPVMLLEGLGKKGYQQRVAVLSGNRSAGAGLTVMCLVFEFIFEVSILVLFFVMIPGTILQVDLKSVIFADTALGIALKNTVCLAAMSIVAPFYVSAGFALYLARRTELEAWDIEIRFRRLMNRYTGKRKSGTAVLCAGLILAGWAVSAPETISAGDLPASREKAGETIEKVLSHKDFGKEKTVTYWRFKDDPKEEKKDAPPWLSFLEPFMKFLRSFSKVLGVTGEFLLWIAAGTAVAYVLYKSGIHRVRFSLGSGTSGRTESPPSELFGLDITPDSLPDDIKGKARELIQSNDIQGALSLLYRGVLQRLVHDHCLDIPEGATEGECLKIVSARRRPDEVRVFSDLTKNWLKAAYAHILPDRAVLEDLLERTGKLYR